MNIILFVLGTIVLVYFSRQNIFRIHSHGFYRFFAWEILLVLFLINVYNWFRDPLAWYQLVSWALLIVSLMLVILSIRLLREIGKLDAGRSDPALLGMEKTTQLVTTGLYRTIRHPMYSSLLFLGWGMFFKSPSWLGAGLGLLCSLFLFATGRVEECENINYFGDEYIQYMRCSKMFIPFIF